MSFKEIKELRKAGKLEEALQMANQALGAEPDNIWNKRAAAWVYYEYLKKFSEPDAFDVFKENLIKIRTLQLPEDEKMIFDSCAWQIGSLVFAMQKSEPVDYGKINELWLAAKDFHYTKPSEAYSFLYKAFHKGYQNWREYLQFADWWAFENFRPEDFLEEEFKGKKVMSIVEQANIAYAKKTLEGEDYELQGFIVRNKVKQERVNIFLPRLDYLITEHPNYKYIPYFKAKLLLASGDEDKALSAFLPFARQKKNDFWVWELMAGLFPEDKNKQFACYCKALILRTPEDFLVKIRQTFSGLLIERKMYTEARTEIDKVIATRSGHDWKLPVQIRQWTEQEWYTSTKPYRENLKLYLKYAGDAEEILFQDISEEIIAVEFVNENKKVLNFVQSKEIHGFFKYTDLIGKPRIGDILKVRFSDYQQDGFCKAFTAKEIDADVACEAIKEFQGEVKIIPPHNIGFVDDVFIEPGLIQSHKLTNKQSISGKAILSFNKKKKEWGWKAFKIGK